MSLWAVKGVQVFVLLAFAALLLEFVWLRPVKNPGLPGVMPTAMLVLENKEPAEDLNHCHYTYLPFTPLKRSELDFLYENTEDKIQITQAEKIDAEYLSQALYAEEEPDLSYRIASLVENGVSTSIKPHDYLDGLKHLKREDLSEEHKSYELYEEELPEGAVSDEFSEVHPQENGYFVYTRRKNVKDVNVNLSKKPYYFGPEPVVAVVIDDMGINQRRTADMTKLKAPLTSSFLTYGQRLNAQVEKASEAGHEIMIHVPMEPKRKANVAPDTLTTQMTEGQIKNGLENMLKKFKEVKGINNHMGSQFTEDKLRMKYVMEILRDHNLFFLDSKTSAKSVGKSIAENYQVPYAHRHVFLDNDNNVDYIYKQLQLAENIARRNGYVIAIGHPKSATYLALKEWLKTLPEKHVRLVHMSEIIKVLNKDIIAKREISDANGKT